MPDISSQVIELPARKIEFNLISPIAFRYPAQIVQVDTSGKRFDRQSAARKSLLHVQTGLHAVEDANDSSNTDSVKRRSRSRKPRGNRRNTIAGTDQKEIEGIAENGFVFTTFFISISLEHVVRLTININPDNP